MMPQTDEARLREAERLSAGLHDKAFTYSVARHYERLCRENWPPQPVDPVQAAAQRIWDIYRLSPQAGDEDATAMQVIQQYADAFARLRARAPAEVRAAWAKLRAYCAASQVRGTQDLIYRIADTIDGTAAGLCVTETFLGGRHDT